MNKKDRLKGAGLRVKKFVGLAYFDEEKAVIVFRKSCKEQKNEGFLEKHLFCDKTF